ncbi:MAG: sulfotransferase family protein [Microcoleaceae cyanobacterium]
MMIKHPPIFIVSSGRSGTTLLRGLLNASQQLYIPHESDFIARTYPLFHQQENFNQEDYKLLVRIFFRNSQEWGWGMSEDYLISYLERANPQSLSEINSLIYQAYLDQEGFESLRWGIKMPVLIANLDRIKTLFPEAKIVHMIRDGRDVTLSYRKVHQTEQGKAKFGPKGVFQGSLYWIDGLRRVEDFNQHYGKDIYELKYEDLLEHTAEELEKLMEFLGLQYDPEIPENYHQSEANKALVLKSHGRTIHAKVEKGIDSKNSQKYLKEMSKSELFFFEVLGAPYLHKYGYDLQFKQSELWIFDPIRNVLYWGARQLNNWRYHRRDLRACSRAAMSLQRQRLTDEPTEI